MNTATSSTTIENDRIKVTTWTFHPPGDSTGQHRHEYDYIVIPITGGRLSVTTPDGEVHHMTQVAGIPYLGTAGTTHTVTTVEAEPLTFVEIEFRS